MEEQAIALLGQYMMQEVGRIFIQEISAINRTRFPLVKNKKGTHPIQDVSL